MIKKSIKVIGLAAIIIPASGCSNSGGHYFGEEVINPLQGCIDMDPNSPTFDGIRGQGMSDSEILMTCSMFEIVNATPNQDGEHIEARCNAFTTGEDEEYYYHTTAAHCIGTNWDYKKIGEVEIYDEILGEVASHNMLLPDIEEGYEYQKNDIVIKSQFDNRETIEVDTSDTIDGNLGAIYHKHVSGMNYPDSPVYDKSYFTDVALFKTKKDMHSYKITPFVIRSGFDKDFPNLELDGTHNFQDAWRKMETQVISFDAGEFKSIKNQKIGISGTEPDGTRRYYGHIVWDYDCGNIQPVVGMSGSPLIDNNGEVLSLITAQYNEGVGCGIRGPSNLNFDIYKLWQIAQGGGA